jgi:hypothetical protein
MNGVEIRITKHIPNLIIGALAFEGRKTPPRYGKMDISTTFSY